MNVQINLTSSQVEALASYFEEADPVVLHVTEGPDGYGLYVSLEEMPEEGMEFIAPVRKVGPAKFWELINPSGQVVALESSCSKAWARVEGYKPTIEALVGYEEAGWWVRPVS